MPGFVTSEARTERRSASRVLLTVVLVALSVPPTGCAENGWGLGAGAKVGGVCDPPGSDLQAILDTGEDLMLCARSTYDLHAPLRYRVAGQRIFTGEATLPRDYAVLRIAEPSMAHAVDSRRLDDVVLERVVVDGNRTRLGAYVGPDNLALVFMQSGDGQIVRNTVIRNTRSWSSLQLHEGGGECRGGLIENNVVLWAGCDARGNGCAPSDPPSSWGDGISMPCRETVVRNNLVIDATDVGIVVFGAPGSTVEGNFVASVSRETFGGVALVDAMDVYAVSGTRAGRDVVTDYRGDSIHDNDLAALGGRIHIGVAIGPPIWFGPDWLGSRSLGPAVIGNRLEGGAFGYGVVSNGSEAVRVEGNTSTATHGGMPDGVGGAAAPPAPFLYRPSTTLSPLALQGDFVASEELTSLLRLYGCPLDGAGFRDCDYSEAEARAIVRMAYVEILGREPDEGGLSSYAAELRGRRTTSDDLRRSLMESDEFVGRFGAVPPAEMQAHRQAIWEAALFDAAAELASGGGAWPRAADLFREAMGRLIGRAAVPPSGAPGSGPPRGPGPSAGDALERGEQLDPGASLVSPDGRFSLVYQGDGNLVLYERATGAPLWASGTGGTSAGAAAMQGDGNFVVYDASGVARWATSTPASAERIVLQDDGNLVVYDGAGNALWASDTGGREPAPPPDPPPDPTGGGGGAPAGDALVRGASLLPGGSIVSTDLRFECVYQHDGNLVLYERSTMAALWSTLTGGTSAGQTVLQGDGNLVVYDASGTAQWASSTPASAARLVMQSDGNLVIYDGGGAPLWASDTGGR